MKKCYKCQILKYKEEFSKNKRYQDGLNDICKLCKKENNILSKEKNKEYREKNKEKQKEYIEKYYSDSLNKEKQKEYLKQYYSDPYNKERKTSYIKEYDLKNKEKRKEYREKWYQENKEYYKKYMINRYKNDILFKIQSNIRSRFHHAIKNIFKSSSITKLVDCNLNQLKSHIEQFFLPEMTWDNHGEVWEIDHIKPCASFDLTNAEQQKQCFHYSNLQPLFKTTEIAESFGYKDYIGNRNKNKRQ